MFTNDRRGAGWMALWLAVVTVAVFWRATECGFINYDDPDYVTSNSHVQQGLSAESIRWAFTTVYEGLWIPLTWLSHMLDWQIYGSHPWGHHLTNVLLHAANTVLLFLLIRLMTGSLWRSAFVAALFALHPLHVETVAWISERKGVLSTLFWLLTLGAYAWYARFKDRDMKAQAGGSYAAALLFFACGLMAKPILVTLPCVLLLLDYWPLERWKLPEANPKAREPRRWAWLVLEKLPFFALTAVFSAMTFSAAPPSLFTAGQRINNALVSYLRYLWKTLWPAKLAVPYPYPPTWDWPVGLVILAAVFLVATTFWVIRRARRQPYLATGWFWFLGTLAPVLGLVRMGFYSLADRYTYVSLIGIFLMVAWAAGEAVAKRRRWRNAAGPLAALLLGLCAWRADVQLGFWPDSGTLFTHALAVTERNCLAHSNLGIYLVGKGHLDEAMKHYREAVRIWPQGARIMILDSGRTAAPGSPAPSR
ncbi:MAG: tetratricopeptide repeat protein [Verrucomicrobia bacterium]|nr:tetratricopeptide repeat protein [Verrucomicrobiota bacterium]